MQRSTAHRSIVAATLLLMVVFSMFPAQQVSFASTMPVRSNVHGGIPLHMVTPGARSTSAHSRAIAAAVRTLPLRFEVNRGQTDSRVAFLARGSGYTVFLTDTQAVLRLAKQLSAPAPVQAATFPRTRSGRWAHLAGPLPPVPAALPAHKPARYISTVLGLQLAGANQHPQVVGLDRLPGVSNYLIGNDPRHWHRDIPSYARIAYRNVYPGVDLVYHGGNGRLEYDFLVRPGADPHRVTLALSGMRHLTLDRQGNLLLGSAGGIVRQDLPRVYQLVNGVQRPVQGGYALLGHDRIGFNLGHYDPHRPLVIDPVVTYSTYLGGSGDDYGADLVVDSTGSYAYLSGYTSSTNFPIPSGYTPYQAHNAGGFDAFVVKLSSSGTTLAYATYLGGTGDDVASGIALTSAGNAVLTGYTTSTNFPTYLPAQSSNAGGADVFVTELNSTGNGLIYSTYLGGTGTDYGNAITLDSTGNAYVTGYSNSTGAAPGYPTTTAFPTLNAYQSTNTGGYDVVVAKLTSAGALGYSTYLGGQFDDRAFDIAVSSAGNAYVIGDTQSTAGSGTTPFPTLNALQATPKGAGQQTGFVTELTTAGSGLVFSTYLGGSSGDSLRGLALDSSNNLFIAGQTSSADFPTTANVLQTAYGGGNITTTVSKVAANGGSLLYSTYLGGSSFDQVGDIAVDSSGDAYVTGGTYSLDFPLLNPTQALNVSGTLENAFISELTPTGRQLIFSTPIGATSGTGGSLGSAITVDSGGYIYNVGYTNGGFPVTSPVYQTSYGGGAHDAYAVKLQPSAGSSPSSGTIPWHPHYTARFSSGLSGSVDLADGHVDVVAHDIAVAGRGPDLTLDHTWDSTRALQGFTTSVGRGWTTDLTVSMSGSAGQTVTYVDAGGTQWVFPYSGGAYQTPAGLPWQLTVSGGYTLNNILSGETMSFNSQGQLTGDTDSYGNSNTLTYNGITPTAYTNGNGRALTLAYQHGVLSDVQTPQWINGSKDVYSLPTSGQHTTYGYGGYQGSQLTALTLGAGLPGIEGGLTNSTATAKFAYTGARLTGVTTPMTMSGTIAVTHTWTLGYDSQNRLTTITSPISGTVGQAGYTPAYTTQITYNSGNTVVTAGYGTPNAITTTYTIDGQGEATQISDGLSHSDHYSYDADHDVTSQTDRNGNTTTTSYRYVGPNNGQGIGSTGLISQTVGPVVGVNSLPPNQTNVQVTTTESYDASNNLTDTKHSSIGGGLGDEETQYTYDGHHGLLTTAELLGTSSSGCGAVLQQGAFPAAVQLPQPQAPLGEAQVQPLTCTTSYQWRGSLNHYNSYGQLDYTVDGRGLTTGAAAQANVQLAGNSASFQRTYAYNGAGDQTSESTPPILTSACPSTPCAATTTTGYDGDGNATSVRSANGNTTSTVFDHLGRASQTILPSVTLFDGTNKQPTSTTLYDGDGNVKQVTDPDGNVTMSSDDPLQRLVSTLDPTGGLTVSSYSATNLASSTDPRQQTSYRYYDAAGRLTKSVDPSGNYTTYQYDNNGNLQVTTAYNAAGTALSTDTKVYDSMNWVTSDTASGPNTSSEQTQYGYDIDGNAILQQDANGEWHQFIYDGVNQRIDTTISTSSLVVLNEEQDTYDLAANAYASITMDGQSHTAAIDADNRTTQSIDVTTGGTTTITATATFDPNGNTLTQHIDEIVSGAHQTHDFSATFNQADWRTQTVDDVGKADALTTTYKYDAAAQQRSKTVTSGQAPVNTTLDNQGRVTAIGESVGGTTSYTGTFGYDGNSDLTHSSLPASTTTVAGTFDNNSRLQQLDLTGPTGVANVLNSHYSYTYDGLSRTSAITSTVNGAVSASFPTHDALGRLKSDGQGQSFTYLPDGNLSTAVNGATTSSYSYATSGQPDELTSLATTGKATLYYGYDNGGTRSGGVANSGGDSTIISTNSSLSADCQSLPDANSTCLSYDAQGRLQTATMPDGTGVVLAYNAAGQRASYTVTPHGASQPSLVELFTYRGGELAQVSYSGSSIPTAYTDTYLFGPGSTPYELLRQSGSTTSRYWYLLNGHDDVVALTDTSGNVVDRYHYDLWGVPSIDLETVKQPLLYAGYWYDRELHAPNVTTGWYWLSVRPYDPALKRFTQPDPSGIEGVRSYVYVGDDPVDGTDPSGLDWWPFGCGFPVGGGLVCGIGDLARGTYQFVVGDDLDTLRNEHASGADKFLAVVDLASNALVIVPIAGEGVEAARLAAKAALKGGAKLEAHQITYDEAVQISKRLVRTTARDVAEGCTPCFPAGTLIATPQGEKAIQTLKVGDLVLAENPSTGKVEPQPLEAMVVEPVQPLLELDLADGSTLRVTPNHAFWVEGGPLIRHAGWLEAGQLLPGDHLRTVVGTEATVIRMRYHVGQAVVYTLTVAHDHTFFVGTARVLVHNGICSTLVHDVRALASKTPGLVISSVARAQGSGFVVNLLYSGKKFVLRAMVSGGGRTYYWRLSRDGKGAIDITGTFSSDRAATHTGISSSSAQDIVNAIIDNVKKYP